MSGRSGPGWVGGCSGAAFHDILTGDSKVAVTCRARLRSGASGTFGFDAGRDYDQATGRGSIDAY